MVRYLVSKKGVPVLASVRSDPAAQSACVLVVKYNEEPFQLSFFLQCTTFIHGFDDEQTFTLIYDADNLMRDLTSLNNATTSLSHDQLTSIARAGNPQIRALALTLAKPCKIRCPSSTGTLTSKSGYEAPFHRLVALAKATAIDITFDYNWVHADNRLPLDRFFKHMGAFSGFSESADGYKYADWAIFCTVEEDRQPPPSYTNAVDTGASRKRPRRVTPPSQPASPPHKRQHHDYGSPTEVATSSPCPPGTSHHSPSEKEEAILSHAHPSLHASDEVAFQEAIDKAVEAQLPAIVESMLPNILRSILPDVLHKSLAPRRSQSSSPPPRASFTPEPSPSLGTLIADRLEDLAKDHLASIFADANDQAYSLRSQADGEFEDVVADHKIDVDTIKEDCIRELGEVVDDKLCKFKEQTEEIVETAVEEVGTKSGEIRDDICDGLEEFIKVASASLKSLREGKGHRIRVSTSQD
ncbi:hypothetical protein BKA58DRAFT_48849 [Alternaria rosae]|uniref:uncharacterized protein n=1 Tax=Alternaria rosae TaxID=1187941 RepID=UPI001E8CC915|nr:uncharacterized protein BKA58DRAFT_48849 [Alternaria rosae]KAH6861219.1 hypothetical protein BKA58DRAFT_48849 [Alternaria rosae]